MSLPRLSWNPVQGARSWEGYTTVVQWNQSLDLPDDALKGSLSSCFPPSSQLNPSEAIANQELALIGKRPPISYPLPYITIACKYMHLR